MMSVRFESAIVGAKRGRSNLGPQVTEDLLQQLTLGEHQVGKLVGRSAACQGGVRYNPSQPR